MFGAKQRAKEAIDRLPDNCTLEDIMYALYVVETIRKRLAMAAKGDTISYEEAERRLAR